MTLINNTPEKINTTHEHAVQTDNHTIKMQNPKTALEGLEVTGVKYLTPLPCYCDIQFSSREFLTVVNNPNHPFSKNLQIIIDEIIKDNL